MASRPSQQQLRKVFIRLKSTKDRKEYENTFRASATEDQPFAPVSLPDVLIASPTPDELTVLQNQEAEIYEDVKFGIFQVDLSESQGFNPAFWATPAADDRASLSLLDVLDHIRAPEAWPKSRGEGVTIVVVDTGIDASLKEMPDAKRHAVDLPTDFQGLHWRDERGHGSMCAVIAAGSDAEGGRYCGVAPDARVVSARTMFHSRDIVEIYDAIITMKISGQLSGPIVINNSYGVYACEPTVALPEKHPYLEVVRRAVAIGIPVIFAAGNNHYDVKCHHDPGADRPNTIWGANSDDAVLSVGTVNRRESNRDANTPHANSSRGPGQWARNHPKPDCVAPTYGETVWGNTYRAMDWWGTSGAAPQAAGLAALLLSARPSLHPQDVYDIICTSSRRIDGGPNCVGSGIIDCKAALDLV